MLCLLSHMEDDASGSDSHILLLQGLLNGLRAEVKQRTARHAQWHKN
jgi:hypothetical protein